MLFCFFGLPYLLFSDQYFSKVGIWSSNGNKAISQETNEDIIKIVHSGDGSYAVTGSLSYFPIEMGDVLQISVDIKITSNISSILTLSFASFDEKETPINWDFGGTTFSNVEESFTTIYSQETIIGYGMSLCSCRIIGYGQTEFELKNFQVKLIQKHKFDIDKPTYVMSSDNILFTFDSRKYNFTVLDKRNNKNWVFSDNFYNPIFLYHVKEIKTSDYSQLDLTFLINNFNCSAKYTLYFYEDNSIEFNLSCPSEMPMTTINYPNMLSSVTKNDRFILPMNEGLTFMADDFSHSVKETHTFGGHGLCMSFFGLYDDSDFTIKKSGLLYIIKTQNDFRLHIQNVNNLQTFQLSWNSEKEKFGSYDRSVQFIFYDKANYVELCKRYRQYAKDDGRLVTFEEKQKKYPKVQFDKLIGAANIWFFINHDKLLKVYEELQSFGVTNILASNDNTTSNINYMNDKLDNILTSRYDAYQDVLDPELYKWTKPYQTPTPLDIKAWPADIGQKSNGELIYGWSLTNISNPEQMIYMGKLCDKRAIDYAIEQITTECVTADDDVRKNYKSRFIDTTTASEWFECYNENHSMTRSDSRKYRMKLLSIMHDFNMICGSETGQDVAVPYCDYFEGMMSLCNFRVPDSGRDIETIWGCEELYDNSCINGQERPVPESVIKFQLGHNYRLPLFELVYHDCIVSYWYWGDYNNKIPSLWVKRDMFNALYGVPPMYLFTTDGYESGNCTADINQTQIQHGVFNETDNNNITTTIFHVKTLHKSNLSQNCFKHRVAISYMISEPVSKMTGYSEMIDFIILNKERIVQKSVFKNNVNVTCNFGDVVFKYNEIITLPPYSVMIQSGKKIVINNKGGKKAAIIAVSVIAALIIVALIICVSVYFIRKKRNHNSPKDSTLLMSAI